MGYTDQQARSEGLAYGHGRVERGAGEYIGATCIHVNSPRTILAVFTRDPYGRWYHCSLKHIVRNSAMERFRLIEEGVKIHPPMRIDALVPTAVRNRITCEGLRV